MPTNLYPEDPQFDQNGQEETPELKARGIARQEMKRAAKKAARMKRCETRNAYLSDMPALYAPLCCYEAMKAITSFTAKINAADNSKIAEAIALVEQSVDFTPLFFAGRCPAPAKGTSPLGTPLRSH